MADWQLTLALKDVYHAEKPMRELAAIVAERLAALDLSRLPPSIAAQRDGLAEEFQALAHDGGATVCDFDNVMDRLYDWADTPLDGRWNGKKVCWVETF